VVASAIALTSAIAATAAAATAISSVVEVCVASTGER
jgi:hypothetical protein